MSQLTHKIYVYTLFIITLSVFVYLGFIGFDYYFTDFDQRFFHEQNNLFKPSGFIGHGAGVIGSLLMIVGVFGYMARKRLRFFSRWGVLKYWLEFHIFLCTLGPVLVLYHTAFKFGGIVAISFWSMVAVVISGVIGRVIYIQIPRTIEGRAMSLNELHIKKANFNSKIQQQFNLDKTVLDFLNVAFNSKNELFEGSFFSKMLTRAKFEKQLLKSTRKRLRNERISRSDRKKIIKYLHEEIVLSRRIAWLSTMQNYLRYWHVAHLPFALIMLVIMIVHVVIAALFGYIWIF